jgi:phage terminase large subunit-like protein
VHGEAIRMVEASAILSEHCNINMTNRVISFEGSSYKALASKASGKEGLNPHCLIVDELHVWKGWDVWNSLKYASIARRQPLRFVITTAGEEVQSVCYETLDYSRDVESGKLVDQRHFSYIREIDEEADDYRDQASWYKANPSLGVTISLRDFAADLAEAERTQEDLATFLRYRFDVWKKSVGSWLNMSEWDRAEDTYDESSFRGLACYGGLDLSQTTDMTSLALAFPFDDESCSLLAYFWLPHDAAEKASNRDEVFTWASQGWLELTDGNVIDYKAVIEKACRLAKVFRIRALAYDKTYAEHATQEIEEESGVMRVVFPQSMMHFAGPTSTFETMLKGGTLRHNGNPILTRQASHCTVKTDVNGNRRPVKPKPGDPRKIDGIVSSIMAIGMMSDRPPEPEPHIYTRRGVIAV